MKEAKDLINQAVDSLNNKKPLGFCQKKTEKEIISNKKDLVRYLADKLELEIEIKLENDERKKCN